MLPTERFLSYVKQHELFEESDKVLLAVSGGRDSVFMVHLFNDAKLNFGIAHCNFGLREKESDADELFVEELASHMKVPFFKIKFQTGAYAEANGISIQMAARSLRYEWFEKIKTENDYRYIAVAHHQSDATETVLLNLIRGTGISGLHGIFPKRGDVIRPLLSFKREEIDQYVDQERLSFREDSSNASDKYARNKIRLKVLPALKELNKDLDETFAENSKRFRELEEFLKTRVEALRSSLFRKTSPGEFSISTNDLKDLYPQQLLLFELFRPFGFQEPVLRNLAGCLDSQPGKIFESSTHTLLLDRNRLLLREKSSEAFGEEFIYAESTQVSFKNGILKISITDRENAALSADARFAFFDAALLQFPLKLRLWKKGDYFHPFGMKGKKKLSDFFTSIKLPLFAKNEIPVLENGNGDIIWVVGLRSDDRYKISPRSKKVHTLEYIKIHEQ